MEEKTSGVVTAPGSSLMPYHKVYSNMPAYFRSGKTVYEIESISPDGKLNIRTVSGPFVLDLIKDVGEIIEEGIANGIFSGSGAVSENPNGIVVRCEAIFEMWRVLGESERYSGNENQWYTEEAFQIVGEDAYYKEAVQWFLAVGGRKATKLYTYRDLEGALTWLELAYILYGAFGLQGTVSLRNVKPKNVSLSQLTVERNGRTVIDSRLSSYKSGRWMKSYLEDIRIGRSYIPLPAYHCFLNMVADGLVPTKKPMMIEGTLRLVGEDVGEDDHSWCLLEVNRLDFENVLNAVKSRF